MIGRSGKKRAAAFHCFLHGLGLGLLCCPAAVAAAAAGSPPPLPPSASSEAQAKAAHMLGLSYLEQGNPEAAARLFHRAIQLLPRAPGPYRGLGLSLVWSGRVRLGPGGDAAEVEIPALERAGGRGRGFWSGAGAALGAASLLAAGLCGYQAARTDSGALYMGTAGLAAVGVAASVLTIQLWLTGEQPLHRDDPELLQSAGGIPEGDPGGSHRWPGRGLALGGAF